MPVYIGSSGKQYRLADQALGGGGEGSVFEIRSTPGYVAKIYHSATSALEKKITLMVNRPPQAGTIQQLAWPLDILRDAAGSFRGFVMKKLDTTNELLTLYKYPPMEFEGITLRHKLIIAQNICTVISGVHQAGYVFGDFNPMNIGVNLRSGSVAFFDTDSYHIHDPYSNVTYRCSVCLSGYVAPELIAACKQYKVNHPSENEVYAHMPLPTFTEETDNFALAIHIFKLLMNGYSPFNGVEVSSHVSQASPGIGDAAVERNRYCFKPGFKPQAEATPPLNSLPQNVQDLFERAFIQGKSDPKRRPSADEWRIALEQYENSLIPCKNNANHVYYRQNAVCPWCEAERRFQARLAGASTVQPVTKLPPGSQKTFTAPHIPKKTAAGPAASPVRPASIWQSSTTFWLVTLLAAALIAGTILGVYGEDIYGSTGNDALSGILEALAPYVLFIGGMVGSIAYNAYFAGKSQYGYTAANYILSILMCPAGMVLAFIALILLAAALYILVVVIIIGAIIGAFSGG